jgi:hypothetical protein
MNVSWNLIRQSSKCLHNHVVKIVVPYYTYSVYEKIMKKVFLGPNAALKTGSRNITKTF